MIGLFIKCTLIQDYKNNVNTMHLCIQMDKVQCKSCSTFLKKTEAIISVDYSQKKTYYYCCDWCLQYHNSLIHIQSKL
jgi:hypothetical protein